MLIDGLALWQLGLLSCCGFAAGFLNVMAGGGSLLTVPVMVFMGIPGPVANGTNRIAILAQNISAVLSFFRRGHSEFRLSLSLTACAVPGAVVGAMLGAQLEGIWFNRILAGIMLAVMLITATGKTPTCARPARSLGAYQPTRRRLLWGHLLMVGVGAYGGFIQIGAGFIIMPVLNRVMGFDLVRTNMHKVFIVGCYTFVALLIYAWQTEILWLAGLALALGNSTGAWLSAAAQVKRGEALIKLILNFILGVFIVKLLFFS